MTGILATSSAPNARATNDVGDRQALVSQARSRLDEHAAIWRNRPLVRDIYEGYHNAIRAQRSNVAGLDLEVGAGHGSFATSAPEVLSCDIVPCPWLDCAADATRLPFRNDSLSNIIMIDVLHHLAHPRSFFDEATRALAPGGRILLLEPYSSPVSWIAWRFFHDEHIDASARPLDESAQTGTGPDDPWDANIAIPTSLFWRDLKDFQERFPKLQVLRRDRFDFLLYPLSGGFEQRPWIPLALVPAVRLMERCLAPLAWLLAFRCFVVIEKPAREPTQ